MARLVLDGTAAELLAFYDLVPPVELVALPHEGKNNLNALVRTGAGAFVAKTYASLSYDDPASIDYEQRLLAWLAGAGLSFDVPSRRHTRASPGSSPRRQGTPRPSCAAAPRGRVVRRFTAMFAPSSLPAPKDHHYQSILMV